MNHIKFCTPVAPNIFFTSRTPQLHAVNLPKGRPGGYLVGQKHLLSVSLNTNKAVIFRLFSQAWWGWAFVRASMYTHKLYAYTQTSVCEWVYHLKCTSHNWKRMSKQWSGRLETYYNAYFSFTMTIHQSLLPLTLSVCLSSLHEKKNNTEYKHAEPWRRQTLKLVQQKESTVSPFISSPISVCLLCAAWRQPPALYQRLCRVIPNTKTGKCKNKEEKSRGGEREERAFTAVVRQCFLWLQALAVLPVL